MAQQSNKQSANQSEKSKQVRYGVVAAGHISQFAFMPGVEHTGNSVMTALVTEDEEKARALSERYGIEHTYKYNEYDELLKSGIVDALYIALPNDKHLDFTVRALEAGIHVLLEKPMAVGEEECRKILDAARKSKAKLMIAYRLHFEPATLAAIEAIRQGEIGKPVFFTSAFSQLVAPENHRASHGFWAGPVADMGPYPINAVRNLFGAEPVEVFAYGTRSGRLEADFEDTVTAILKFEDNRTAQFTVSYAAPSVGTYQVVGANGNIQVQPGYTYGAPVTVKTQVDDKTTEQKFPETDQFGGELKYFSDCVLSGKEPEPDAEEGLLDVRVVAAIEQALKTGKPQKLAPAQRKRRPEESQVVKLPAARKLSDDELVNAKAPAVK